MRSVQTLAQLHELQNTTYVYAAIVVVAIFLLSWLSANAIAYRGGDDRSYITRRVLWVAWTVALSLGFWLWNQAVVMGSVKKVAFQSQFSHTNLLCLAVTIVGSVVLSLVVMWVFPHSKFGSILGKRSEA